MKKYILVLGILCFSGLLMGQDVTPTSVVKDNFNEADYFISQSFVIEMDDYVGRMELLQDIKLKNRKSTAYKYSEDLDITTMETPQDKLIQYEDAILRLKSKDEKVVFFEKLSSAWVSIVTEKMYGDERQTYFVRQDYQKGYGVDSGFGTELYELHGGKLVKIRYRLDNKKEPGLKEYILLYSNLRTGYRVVGSKKVKMILYAHTWWGGEKVEYSRYEFDGKFWVCYSRTAKGFFEADGDAFPEMSLFYGQPAAATTPNP